MNPIALDLSYALTTINFAHFLATSYRLPFAIKDANLNSRSLATELIGAIFNYLRPLAILTPSMAEGVKKWPKAEAEASVYP